LSVVGRARHDHRQVHGTRGVAADAAGNIYVADTGNKRVQRFSSDGTFLTAWGSQGQGESQFMSPAGIAVTSDGSRVFVTDRELNRVQAFSSSGVFHTQFGTRGPEEGQLQKPVGVAVSPDGYVYVSDCDNHRIQKFVEHYPVEVIVGGVEDGGAYRDPVTPSVTFTGGEVASSIITLDDEIWAPVEISAEGSYVLYAWAKDIYDFEDSKTVSFVIDMTPPEVSDDALDSYRGTASILLSATDALSGVASVSYSLNGGVDQVVAGASATVMVSQPGDHVLSYYATDRAGNVSSTAQVEFEVVEPDTTPPVSTAVFVPSAPNGLAGWYTTAPSVTIDAVDDDSGVDYTEWRLNGGSWVTGTTVTGIVDGSHVLEYRSVDNDGNVEQIRTAAFKVDTTPPSTTSNAVALYEGSALIALTGHDAVSGLGPTYYRLNDGPQSSYTGPISITELGSYTLHFWSVDLAGNAEGQKVVNFEVVPEPLPPVLEVAGADRIRTAVEASELGFPDGAEYVVIATARNWPDALGGSALAGVLDGPVLLTEPGGLPVAVLDEIDRLGAENAVILGGTGAVSSAVEAALKATLGDPDAVERIDGLTRYETADKIAERVIELQGAEYDGWAFVATGANFPDALAAAPLAAAQGWPLFLVHPTGGILPGTEAAMAEVEHAVYPRWHRSGQHRGPNQARAMLGGTDAVERLDGLTRYETAVKIASFAVDEAGHTWDRVGIATGADYPDALAGGVLQGKVGSVMLLTPPSSLAPATAAALEANADAIDTVTFFGGTGAVSTAVRTAVLQLVQ
jgi:putative cell wall-binding protein